MFCLPVLFDTACGSGFHLLGVVLHGREPLGGNGLGLDGVGELARPLVDGQGAFGIVRIPRGHTEGEAGEGGVLYGAYFDDVGRSVPARGRFGPFRSGQRHIDSRGFRRYSAEVREDPRVRQSD